MTENWQKQTKEMIEQGKQAAAGLVSGGEMVIDADPEKGFFRVKLRNIQPPQAIPQLTTGFCWLLTNGAAMLSLEVKQYFKKPEEDKNESAAFRGNRHSNYGIKCLTALFLLRYNIT